jgi:hypothetical protein
MIAGHLVAAQQSSKQPDGDFKILDFNVLIKRKIGRDEFPRLVGLIVQAHDDHGVQGVNGSHEQ